MQNQVNKRPPRTHQHLHLSSNKARAPKSVLRSSADATPNQANMQLVGWSMTVSKMGTLFTWCAGTNVHQPRTYGSQWSTFLQLFETWYQQHKQRTREQAVQAHCMRRVTQTFWACRKSPVTGNRTYAAAKTKMKGFFDSTQTNNMANEKPMKATHRSCNGCTQSTPYTPQSGSHFFFGRQYQQSIAHLVIQKDFGTWGKDTEE